MSTINKIKVAILGTGNIGTDLLIKIIKSEYLECTLFTGRRSDSVGIAHAKFLGINISDKGIDAIIDNPKVCDIVIDCTSAQAHSYHWDVCKTFGKTIIDMTPAKLGIECVPAITTADLAKGGVQNINMITCGGQTSVPIAYALSQAHSEIEYIEVVSSISSASAGPATRQNLDEYIETTQSALRHFSGAKDSKAVLILNPAVPPIYMQTTIYAKIKHASIDKITESVNQMIEKIQKYSPGYKLVSPPSVNDDLVTVTVKVLGAGDYLPQYAGNLDIINCAAIEVLELIAKSKNEKNNHQ